METTYLIFHAVRGSHSHAFTHYQIFSDSAPRRNPSLYLSCVSCLNFGLPSEYTYLKLNLYVFVLGSGTQFKAEKSTQDSNISPNPDVEISKISAHLRSEIIPMAHIPAPLVAVRLRRSVSPASAYFVLAPLLHPATMPDSRISCECFVITHGETGPHGCLHSLTRLASTRFLPTNQHDSSSRFNAIPPRQSLRLLNAPQRDFSIHRSPTLPHTNRRDRPNGIDPQRRRLRSSLDRRKLLELGLGSTRRAAPPDLATRSCETSSPHHPTPSTNESSRLDSQLDWTQFGAQRTRRCGSRQSGTRRDLTRSAPPGFDAKDEVEAEVPRTSGVCTRYEWAPTSGGAPQDLTRAKGAAQRPALRVCDVRVVAGLRDSRRENGHNSGTLDGAARLEWERPTPDAALDGAAASTREPRTYNAWQMRRRFWVRGRRSAGDAAWRDAAWRGVGMQRLAGVNDASGRDERIWRHGVDVAAIRVDE
ncbi:hypothetical protein C8R43DRAFT_1232349 [Mycena crocata]|nr:hypothetical protein C8R43DRAFT_1232349 [Mycena crocata]